MFRDKDLPGLAVHLTDRVLLRIAGEDAFDFIQNIITNDLKKSTPGNLVYACLLTPQGGYLHDFFIGREGDAYVLDCEAERIDDLMKRLLMFKLRAKVTIDKMESLNVYAVGAEEGLPDPRLPKLGGRLYTGETIAKAKPVSVYHDFCIDFGVPCSSLSIVPQKDTMADVNLDRLHAVAWDKGCFIGQEVAARMHNRNIVKRRLYTVQGHGLPQGGKLYQNAREVGEIRQISSSGDKGLAQIKVTALVNETIPVLTAKEAGSERLLVKTPDYIMP